MAIYCLISIMYKLLCSLWCRDVNIEAADVRRFITIELEQILGVSHFQWWKEHVTSRQLSTQFGLQWSFAILFLSDS